MHERVQRGRAAATRSCASSAARSARPPALIHGLQRTLGNQAVAQLLRKPSPAAAMPARAARMGRPASGSELSVSQPGDALEREADRMADAIMGMREPASPGAAGLPRLGPTSSVGVVQRKCSSCEQASQTEPAEEPLDRDEPMLLRKAEAGATELAGGSSGTMAAPASTSTRVRSLLQGAGQPLSSGLRGFFEPRFGRDLGDVRVHAGAEAEAVSSQLGARAFALGRDVVIGPGQPSLESEPGKRLLAHELAHVVQQSSPGAGPQAIALSPAPPMIQRDLLPPGNCVQGIHDAMQRTVKAWCDHFAGRACDGTESCSRLQQKIQRNQMCAMARTAINDKCYEGGDLGHRTAASDARKAQATCMALYREKCEKGKQRRRRQPEEKPFPVPVPDPEAALKTAFVLAALGATAAIIKNGLKGAAGKAFVYAQGLAAVILLASGKAEAKISLTGDSPLEALYAALSQDGVPVPDDLKKLIESDPELKKTLEEAAKKGNMSDVQKELARKYAEYLSQHASEYSEEELKTLMSTTEQVGVAQPGEVNADVIEKALQAQADNKAKARAGAAGGGANANANAGKTQAPAADKGQARPGDSQSPKLKDLSTATKRKIDAAPAPVARLFREFIAGHAGLAVTDATAQKFFEIVPSDLTDAQAQALISRLASSEGSTPEQVFEALKQGVAEVRKNPSSAPADGAGNAANKGPGLSQGQLVAKLKELAQHYDFKNIPKGTSSVSLDAKSFDAGKFSTYAYVRLNSGVGVVGLISGTYPASVDVRKLGNKATVQITISYQSRFVDKDGHTYDLNLDKTMSIAK